MNRELLLLRHGKSDWGMETDDFSRPLKSRGVKAASRLGAWLLDKELTPDLVLSSDAERAISTARICCSAMGLADAVIREDQRLYLADPLTLLQVLSELPADYSRVMLVGHNPGLETLLIRLIGGFPPSHNDGKMLPTGTLAHVIVSSGWSDLELGSSTLVDIVRGKSLKETITI